MRGKASRFDITTSDVRAKWAADLKSFAAAVVVLDCLRPVLDALGLDENRDAGKFLVAFDALLDESGANEGAVVHHFGHGSERGRGDSRILDWPDATWNLLRKDPDDPASERYFKANGRDVDVRESQLGYDEGNRKLTHIGGSRADADADAALPHVVTYLRQQDGASQTAIQTKLKDEQGIPVRVTKRAIDAGIYKRLINVDKAGNGNKITHHLTTLANEIYPTDTPIRTDT
jgi:hypothetical protein